MHKLQKYIIQNLSTLFLTIFLSLFAIASIIFLIKLATYTAIIQLSILEMLKLYIFVLPELLFYTLPISFFVAAALTIFRLSNDNEIIVLFALGIHPKFILRTLLKPALLLSVLLLFNFLIVYPHAKYSSNHFIAKKKNEAKFNLSASEFGHKFGDWLLYIGKEDKNKKYAEVFLFNKNEQEEILIEADQAEIINKDGVLTLKLLNGEGYSYSKDRFTQIDFKEMYINNTFQTNEIVYETPLKYWTSENEKNKRTKRFITNTLMSLFPLFGLFLILSISIVHARHHNSMIYLYMFFGILIYYGATLALQKQLMYYTIPLVSILWLSTTYYIYRKAIVSRF